MSKTDTQVTSLDDDAPVATAAPAAPTKGRAAASAAKAEAKDPERRVLLTIHPSGEDGGTDAVFLSVNGYAYQIPRGKPFEVPYIVVGALKLAVYTTYKTEGGNTVESSLPRFAYNVEEL